MRTSHPERVFEFDADGQTDGFWDVGRIAQAISNLIGNALQHGSKIDPILLKVVSDDAYVTVNNQGAPIPKVNIEIYL